jgi:D-glycero-beta-D-manno-heptose-7-phosphate kinase
MKIPSYEAILNSFHGLRILVVGDVMLDRFAYGTSNGVSIETGSPILKIGTNIYHAGGAANVAVQIKALGGTPFLVGPVGNDLAGQQLIHLLSDYGIETDLLFAVDRPTTVKSRYFQDGELKIRIDEEVEDEIALSEWSEILPRVAELMPSIDVLVFQDYDKGFLHHASISTLTDLANAAQVPFVVDPKFRNFHTYKGAFLLKPNKRELESALGRSWSEITTELVRDFLKKNGHYSLLVTLGDRGLVLITSEMSLEEPGIQVENPDVTGAGDSVIAIVSMAVVEGLDSFHVVRLANAVGALACRNARTLPVQSAVLLDYLNKSG